MIAANPAQLLPVLRALSVLCVKSHPQPSPSRQLASPNPSYFNFKLSTFNRLSPKLFRIRTSGKHACNPIGMCTSKTKHLKLFRMSTSKKTGRGEGAHRQRPPNGVRESARRIQFGTALVGTCFDATLFFYTACGSRIFRSGVGQAQSPKTPRCV